MTTVVWNQARSAQKSYKTPQPPRELSAEGIGRAISTSDNACKTCGYVIHKDGCPDRPRGEVAALGFVEPRIYQVPGDRIYSFPPIVGIERGDGQTCDPTGKAFSLKDAVESIGGFNSVSRGEPQPAVYTQAQFDAMREQLVGEVMRQKTIAANVASMVVRSRTELQQVRHESAMLQMERDRMATRPDFMWSDKERAFHAVRYGTPADETRLAQRIADLHAREAMHRAEQAERLTAQQLADNGAPVSIARAIAAQQNSMAQPDANDLDRYRRLLYGDPAPQFKHVALSVEPPDGYARQTIVHKAKATTEELARFRPEDIMTAAEATQKYEEWLVRNNLK